ncbi:MAG: 2-dehydropantoate 2-reductase N-terminal domain-containing protein, partial [Oscillospiraceae bacterium]
MSYDWRVDVMANITILGAGGFGLSLAIMCDKNGHSVNVWSHNKQAAETLSREREHKSLLKGRKIPETVFITDDISVSKNSDIVIVAVPSVAVRDTCSLLKNHLKSDAIVACVSKGFEQGSLKLLSEVMDEEFVHNDNVIISGPSHAEEVSLCEPTTVVAASKSRKAAEKVQDILMN